MAATVNEHYMDVQPLARCPDCGQPVRVRVDFDTKGELEPGSELPLNCWCPPLPKE